VKSIEKILIFRLSSIGDIILTTSLIRNLRKKFPHAQIDFVVKRQFASLLEVIPAIDKVYTFDSSQGFKGLRKLRKDLSKEHYDVLLDIHKNWRSKFIRNTIRAKKTYTYKKHVFKRYLMIKHKVDAYHIVRPVYKRFLDSAIKLGVEDDGGKTEIIIPSDIQKYVDNYLEDHQIKPHKTIYIICPGASFKNKEWQIEKYTELANRIINDLKSQVVLLGGSKEKEVCNSIAKSINGPILNVSGKFTLAQSGALLNRAQATIVGDTGMLHMSEALNVPVVGIYGPTVRQFGYFPILDSSKVAQLELHCRPCTKMGKNSCPKGDFECTKNISVNHVYNLLLEIIQEKK